MEVQQVKNFTFVEEQYNHVIITVYLCSLRYFENFEHWYIEHIIVSLQDVMDDVFVCQEIFVAEEVNKHYLLQTKGRSSQ